jgi:DNA repair ATPase RecN
MKASRVSPVWILGGAALTAGLILYGSWSWKLHNEADVRLEQCRMLESRDQALRAEVEAGTRTIRELMESLRVASNRVDEVERRLDAEKKTHEPLRRQIEKMMAEQINTKARLKAKAASTNETSPSASRQAGRTTQ